jgi:hypothetical protein
VCRSAINRPLRGHAAADLAGAGIIIVIGVAADLHDRLAGTELGPTQAASGAGSHAGDHPIRFRRGRVDIVTVRGVVAPAAAAAIRAFRWAPAAPGGVVGEGGAAGGAL